LAAGSYANVAASLSTQGFGAVEPIPNSKQVALALKNLIVKN
jgi:sugar/nucleoside kinase (ribokinase family)